MSSDAEPLAIPEPAGAASEPTTSATSLVRAGVFAVGVAYGIGVLKFFRKGGQGDGAGRILCCYGSAMGERQEAKPHGAVDIVLFAVQLAEVRLRRDPVCHSGSGYGSD